MKHWQIQTNVYFLLILLLPLYSCKGQEKANSSKENQLLHTKEVKLDSAAQISEYVVEVFEDSKGNLWMGTMSDGAVTFDGKELRYFSTKEGLCDNTVASVAEDHEGNIWFGTHAGASKYAPSAESKAGGKAFVSYREAEGLHGMGCNILVDRNGNIWAGTNHGLFRYNGTSFSPFDIPNPVIKDSSYKWVRGKVWCLMEDKKGNIWIARDGLGACKFDGKTFTHFTEKEGLCSNNVSNIVEDKQGNIWFSTLSSDYPKELKNGGLCRYDPSKPLSKSGNAFTKFPDYEGLSKNDIYSLYRDKNGNIWIGATGRGVYRYDGKSFNFYKGTDRMDLTWSMGIQSILEDSKGTLWFGFSGGLFRFNGKAIVNVPKGDLWK